MKNYRIDLEFSTNSYDRDTLFLIDESIARFYEQFVVVEYIKVQEIQDEEMIFRVIESEFSESKIRNLVYNFVDTLQKSIKNNIENKPLSVYNPITVRITPYFNYFN